MARSQRPVRENFCFVLGVTSIKLIAVVGLVIAACASCFAGNTYYVSRSSGSDSYSSTQAQSKSTPWAHLPGMASHPSYTPVAGDTFILKGCDIWSSSDLPVSWNWSGTSGSPITITVDKTWYNTTNCPSGWNRPIFDNASHTVFSPNTLFNVAASGLTSYGVIDNIEFKGLTCTSTCTSGWQINVWCYNSCSNWTFSNLYFHAWNIQTDGNCMMVGYGASSTNNTWTQSVVDGSDATGASPAGGTCNGIFTLLNNVTNNVIHDVPNAIVGSAPSGATITIAGNLIYNINASNSGAHANFIETTAGNATYLIHDNVMHDQLTAGVEAMMLQNPGETDYVWNNVLWNIGNMPTFPQDQSHVGTAAYFFNNTIVSSTGGPCFVQAGPNAVPTLEIKNNHCITSGALTAGLSGSPTITTNVTETPTQATSAPNDYLSSATYAFSPGGSNWATVGQGTDLSGNCSGSLAQLCNETYYACTYDSSTQSVSCPANGAIKRPSGVAWDVGAYQFASSGGALSPPTGLAAVVQ